jgi:hypothetical protein
VLSMNRKARSTIDSTERPGVLSMNRKARSMENASSEYGADQESNVLVQWRFFKHF